MKKIYKDPKYYDLVFNWDPSFEIRIIQKIIKQYNLKTKDILDIGCGSGRVSLNLAKLGYKVIGIDSEQQMVDLFNQKAKSKGIIAKAIKCDMVSIPPSLKSDCAISLLDTISYLDSVAKIMKHLKSVYKILRKDGIYIIDMRLYKDKTNRSKIVDKWEVSDGPIKIHCRFSSECVDQDHDEQVIHLKISENGKKFIINHQKKVLLFNISEFRSLSEKVGFAFNIWQDKKSDWSPESVRYIILKKQ